MGPSAERPSCCSPAPTEDPASEVRGTALSCYALLALDMAESTIRGRAADDPSPDVRSRALTTLAWQWPNSPETMAALRHALADDPDPEVREAAEAGLGAVAHLTSGT
ncbi:HEAT repeat domain-containing protein [Kitasatospora sp. NPDC058048]|uniref:HEAT repeat domain-containing protein n=1 Tax=Kitasatospora sp. NPDC058048 TaxID=3346313 RepID=UPI0036DDB902